jgi:hypothetical protein
MNRSRDLETVADDDFCEVIRANFYRVEDKRLDALAAAFARARKRLGGDAARLNGQPTPRG